MKKLIYLWLLWTACTLGAQDKQQRLYLDGEWDFRIDSLDMGISEQWYNEKLPDAIILPGSVTGNPGKTSMAETAPTRRSVSAAATARG